MKFRTIAIAGVFLFTVVLLGLLVLPGFGKQSSSSKVPTDMSEVDEVQIAHRTGELVVLSRTNSKWMVNKRYEASRDAMENLIDAVERLAIRYQPPRSSYETIRATLNTIGLSVKFFRNSGEPFKSYLIGGSTNDELGTYLMFDGSEEVLAVHIPGWEGNPSVRFRLFEHHWRSRLYHQAEPDELNALAVIYNDLPGESFILKRNENGFEVGRSQGRMILANEAKVTAYLMDCITLGLESFENSHPLRDQITSLPPFAILTIETEHMTKKLTLFPGLNVFTSPNETERDQLKTRFFALTDSGDFVLIQDRQVTKFLRGYSYFVE